MPSRTSTRRPRRARRFNVSESSRSSRANDGPMVNAMQRIVSNPTNFIKARFFGSVSVTTNSEFVQTVTAPNLLAIPGAIALTTSTAALYAQAIKLKRICVFASPITTAIPMAPTTVGLVWYNTTGRTNSQVISHTSINPMAPACASAAPPKNSFCNLWYSNSNDALFDFIITGQSGTYQIVIEVDLDWVASNQSNNPVISTYANTLVVGATYYPPLDGVSSHIFLRQGLPSAF